MRQAAGWLVVPALVAQTALAGSSPGWRRASAKAKRTRAERAAIVGRRAPTQNAGRRNAQETLVIRKLPSGGYRLYSRKVDPKTGKRRNLGTFRTRAEAQRHERAVQFFKRRG